MHPELIAELIKNWFSKSILDAKGIDLDDVECYKNVLPVFQLDYNRYFDNNLNQEKLCSRMELIGILLYRVARYHYLNGKEDWATQFSNLGRLISGFEIYYSAEIGGGLKINHGLGSVIGARCTIGKNALIHQNVTFGDRNGKRPVLMDNVVVYAGAKILGGIVIGNNATIGANAVCFIDVPENAKAVGVPAKIIK